MEMGDVSGRYVTCKISDNYVKIAKKNSAITAMKYQARTRDEQI
jgi:hypothetical protein